MRMNYSNWPAVQVIDKERCAKYINDDFEHFFCAFNAQNFLSEKEAWDLQTQTYFEILDGFFATDNVYYISKAFLEALKKSAATLYKMLGSKEECDKVYEDCAFVMDDILWIVKRYPDGFTRFLRIQKEGALFTSFIFRLEGDNRFSTYQSTTTRESERGCVGIYYLLMMLKRYGQAEIETIPKMKKVRSSLLNEKSLNETGIEVKVLDSRWFTTICRDEGFLVSGHFRLQNYINSDGQWDKKLIYIDPYAKKGYHRLAPVVNIYENG